jgi:DUF1680 family protein
MLREADDHRVDIERDPDYRPDHWAIEIRVDADQPVEFSLRLRLPSWLRAQAGVRVNNQEQPAETSSSGFLSLKRVWRQDQVRIVFPKGLTASPLPDRPDTVAFLDGPVVLAALTSGEVTLTGDAGQPDKFLVADNEREWASWLGGYRTVNQSSNLRFVPLNSITDQAYTVYCQIRRT